MKDFVEKLVEANSWATSYAMEPYDSYKRRKGYMDKLLRALAEAMGKAPDGRFVPLLQYMANVVANQMGLGKTEPEREAAFSTMSRLLNSLIDLITRMEEGKDLPGHSDLSERVMDILEMMEYRPSVRTLGKVQRLVEEMYRLIDRVLGEGRVSERVLSALDEVVFVLSRGEEEALDEARSLLRGVRP
ncbi:MAG: hypothetical protein GXO29_01210 [Thermotogae bacterium]|nr:hypothetical protein [Thermotogota bacterium]